MANYLKQELYDLIKRENIVFDFFLDGSLDGLWFRDLENPENEWMNPRFWEILGYDPKEMPHKASTWQDIIHQDDLKLSLDNFHKHLADSGYPYDQEVRYTHKNGSTVWVRCRGLVIRDADGKPIRMLGAHQDITAQKEQVAELKLYRRHLEKQVAQKSEELVESERRFRILFDDSPSGIYETDAAGKCLMVNKRWQEMAGMTREEALGDGWTEGVYEEDRQKIADDWCKYSQSGESWSQEYRFCNKEGVITWVYGVAKPIINEDHEITGYIGTNTDITERKAAQQEVQKQRDIFETVINSVPARIFWKDRNSVYLGCNPNFARDAGVKSVDEVVGQKDEAFAWGKDAELYRADDRKVMESGLAMHQYEEPFIGIDGEEVIWETNKIPLKNSRGEIIGVLATSENITRRKKAETKLAQKQYHLENAQALGKIGSWDLDIARNELIWTDENYRVFGIAIGTALTYEIFLSRVHPEDREFVDQKWSAAMRGEEAYDIIHRLMMDDGEVKWVREKADMVFDDSGNCIRGTGFTQDITDRILAEEQLKKSEEKLRLAIDKSPLGITLNDMEGRFVSVNKAYEKIVGYTEEELLKMSFFDITHPDYLPENQKIFAAMASQKVPGFAIEKKYIHKNGNLIDVRINAGTIQDEQGKPLFGMAFTEDISEQKKAAEELQKLYKDLKAIYENDPTFIIFKDTENNILSVSESVARMTGLPKEEIEGKPSREIYPEMADKYYRDDLEVMQSGKPKLGIIEPLPTVNGNTKWLLTNKIPYVDKDGKIKGIILFSSDITELKRNEERYKRAEQIGNVGNWEFEIKEQRFWASAQARELFGLDPEQAFFTLEEAESHIPDRKKTNEALTGLIEKGKAYNIEYEVHIPGTQRKRNLHSAAVLEKDAAGRPLKVSGVILDITERIKAKNELILAKEKAEENNRLKSEFLRNMSHEIRTPMNGIMGFSKLLGKSGISDEKRNYYTSIIQNSSRQLLRIINDILEISILETKQQKANHECFHLNDFLMEMFSIFDLKAKERKLPFYLKKGMSEEKSMIISDRSKLAKILSNLLENAFKFTTEGFIEIGYTVESPNLVLYVKDTGTGISKKNMERIFERFSQESEDIAPIHGGLGLGLSIARENAQLLGGDIRVESEKGKGTTFYVSIPHQTAGDEEAGERKYEKAGDCEEHEPSYYILVAEDDEVNYEYLEVIIYASEKTDCQLIHAKNGKEAVDICHSGKKIHLVLMDIKMPVMNGLIATKKIKEKYPDLPVIAQTAYSTEAEKKLALEHGCDDFISKPTNESELINLIHKYLKANYTE